MCCGCSVELALGLRLRILGGPNFRYYTGHGPPLPGLGKVEDTLVIAGDEEVLRGPCRRRRRLRQRSARSVLHVVSQSATWPSPVADDALRRRGREKIARRRPVKIPWRTIPSGSSAVASALAAKPAFAASPELKALLSKGREDVGARVVRRDERRAPAALAARRSASCRPRSRPAYPEGWRRRRSARTASARAASLWQSRRRRRRARRGRSG